MRPTLQGPDDGELERTVSHISAGCAGQPWVEHLEQVLSIAHRYPGGMTEWDRIKVSEFMLWALPRNLNVPDAKLADAGQAVVELLRRLPGLPGSPSPSVANDLAELAESLLPDYLVAVGVRGRWGQQKRMLAPLHLHDVSVPSMSELRRRMDAHQREYNALPSIERARIGGPTIGPAVYGHPYEPVRLAPADALADLALNSVQMRRMTTLIEYAGEGIPLTKLGNLRLADGRALVEAMGTRDDFDHGYGDITWSTRTTADLVHLDRLLTMARAAGLTKVRHGKLSATKAGRDLARDPLRAAGRLLATHLDPGPGEKRWLDSGMEFVIETLLLDAYEMREPMLLCDVHAYAARRIRERFEIERTTELDYRVTNRIIDVRLIEVLLDLRDLGVIVIDPVDAITEQVIWRLEFDFLRAGDASLNLTPLGLALVQPMAARYGDAPIIESLVGRAPAVVLMTALDGPSDFALADVVGWISEAGEEDLIALGESLASGSEAAWSIAMPVLVEAGTRAGPVLAAADPSMSGMALVWGAACGLGEVSVPDDDAAWVSLMHAVLVVGGPAALAPWLLADPVLMDRLERIWRLEDPRVLDVLAGVTAAPVPKDVGKLARRSLFRRSSR